MNGEQIPLQPNEEITPIQGYEGLYSITSFGRVWSHEKIRKFGNRQRVFKARFLKYNKDKDGYLLITLCCLKSVKFKVHRLVAQHFISNLYDLPEVNHIDGDKQNNYAGTAENNYIDGNLEWCTKQDNANHAAINKLYSFKKTSKFYGVRFDKNLRNRNKPWRSQINNNKQIHIGNFRTEIEAAKAYNDYIVKHNLNRPLNKL